MTGGPELPATGNWPIELSKSGGFVETQFQLEADFGLDGAETSPASPGHRDTKPLASSVTPNQLVSSYESTCTITHHSRL